MDPTDPIYQLKESLAAVLKSGDRDQVAQTMAYVLVFVRSAGGSRLLSAEGLQLAEEVLKVASEATGRERVN